MTNDDFNRAINLVYEETGLLPEVDSAEELASALLEWGSALALENEQLRTELAALKGGAIKQHQGRGKR